MSNDPFHHKYIKYKTKYEALKQSDKMINKEKSLYDRLGGIYAIAAVVDYFSNSILEDALVGKNSKNPYLREWASKQPDRLAGLKFMRTLWVCEATGGPYKYVPTVAGIEHMNLEKAHDKFHISPDEFDQVAKLLKQSMQHYKVPEREMGEVLAAFAAHKNEVVHGFYDEDEKICRSNCVQSHSQQGEDYVWLNVLGHGHVAKVYFCEPPDSDNWRLYDDHWWKVHCKAIDHRPEYLVDAHMKAFVNPDTRFARMRFHFEDGTVTEPNKLFWELERDYFREHDLC